MDAQRWLIAVVALTIFVAGSAVAWFVLSGSLPKKSPMRARQVVLFPCDYKSDNFENIKLQAE